MMRHLHFCAALAALIIAAPAAAQAPSAPPSPFPGIAQGQSQDQPVQIEAATLEVRDKDKQATYTDKHGLKDLVREVLGQDLSKQQQLSDWGSAELSEAQVSYAAADVTHLHALRRRLDAMLAREGREQLAAACFRFLPDRVRLDVAGFAAEDIFAHS